MTRLVVFNSVSLDGYFTDARSDMSFAHNPVPDSDWDAFVAGNARGGGRLIFGRITYEMMASFWPTPAAAQALPDVAVGMNRLPKVVFSRTLESAPWNNTRLVKTDLIGAIQQMKKESPEDMAILGSGSLVSQLAPQGLIDEYQIVAVPVVLGKGRTMFEGIGERLPLRLIRTQSFANGNVLMCYAPLK
jgi:dihydrofolate reductase